MSAPADPNKSIYELFRASIILKAIGSIGEMIAGACIALIPSSFVLHTALLLTQGDGDGDVDDFVDKAITTAAHSLTGSHSILIGVYLFIRGLVQFLIVLALFKNKLWAYPALVIVLVIIIVTQAYDIYLSHSIAASVITVLDLITIVLVWREYRLVKKLRNATI